METILKNVPYIDILKATKGMEKIKRERVYFVKNLTHDIKKELKHKIGKLSLEKNLFIFKDAKKMDKHRTHLRFNDKDYDNQKPPTAQELLKNMHFIKPQTKYSYPQITETTDKNPKITLKKSPIYILFWFFAMQKKYKNCCFPFYFDNFNFSTAFDFVEPILFIVDINSADFSRYEFQYNTKMKKITEMCFEGKCKRFIIFLFGIRYNYSAKEENHMNSIIIDKKKKIITIFDPWGKTKFYKQMQKIYSDIKKTILGEVEYDFLDYKEYNNKLSFQMLEPKKEKSDYPGYCFFWNLWFIETVVANPEMSLKDIVKANIKMITDNYTNFAIFIKSYIAYIHELFFDIERNVDWDRDGIIANEKLMEIFQKRYKQYLREVKTCQL